MPARRSILLHGLRLVVTVPGALVWTYALNLGLAVVFSLRLHAQLASLLNHSLAAERLTSAFDLGTLTAALSRLNQNAPSAGASPYLGLPLYLLGYFILVPGTLFCFQSSAPSRLPILLSSGIAFFWRFVRITLLTLIVSAILLGPLLFLQARWSAHVDEAFTGRSATLRTLPGLLLIVLLATLLRLYFDLVEVYTIQLGDRFRPSGRQDRRVRRTLLPALRALRANFARAYLSFLLLTLLGLAAVILTGRIAAHMLAAPRVWPMFLLAQAGLFTMLLTRIWQRGAETILACDFPMPSPETGPAFDPLVQSSIVDYPSGERRAAVLPPLDAQPDPEPAAPSLPEPDPGVFHHEPGLRAEGSGLSEDPDPDDHRP